MPIKFSTNTHADVLMLTEVATDFLDAMGLKTSTPGALRSTDIPPVLEKLQRYVSQEKGSKEDSSKQAEEDPTVSVKVRSAPLLGLLQHAIEADEIVSWKDA